MTKRTLAQFKVLNFLIRSSSCRRAAIQFLIVVLRLCLGSSSQAQEDLYGSIRSQPKPSKATLLSQTLSQTPSRSIQQGNQIVLNGRFLPGAWSQWQANGGTQIGLSDAGLQQVAGIELLNTADATRQPVQWFSDPKVTPLNLSTRLIGSLRYLDIAALTRQFGWQVQANGTALQITLPAAKVLAVRQGKQPWGDRFVIEINLPATWQIDQQGQEVLLTLDAPVDPALLQSFKPASTNQIQSFKLEPGPNQTRFRLSVAPGFRPRIWSLPAPNRLIIDIRPDPLVDQDILWAPGLRWRRQTLTLGSSRFPVVWFTVNPRQPGINLRPILPNPATVMGIAPLAQTARNSQAAAAINGGFFNRNNQLPLGAIRWNGRWFSGPILNRGAIAWSTGGDTLFGRLSLQETVVTLTGQRLPLTYLNSAYVQAGIARYTVDWGTTYTSLSDNEIIVSVQNNQVIDQQAIAAAGSRPISIPSNGYLLVLRANKTGASAFTVGTALRLESATEPSSFGNYQNIVAAGPLLIQNSQIVLDAKAEKFSNAFIAETASRSAIGRTADGSLLIVAVHNRIGGEGPNLVEVAQLTQQLGAIDALNLDGGSSTTLYLGGQIIDRLPRTAARVHNGIGIFIQPNP